MKKKSISVSEDTHQELWNLKIKAKAKDLDEIIRELIIKVKEDLKVEKSPDAFISEDEE